VQNGTAITQVIPPYLRKLAAAGVPVLTTFLGPDDEVRLPAGNGCYVVKPSGVGGQPGHRPLHRR
jgi:hypothetical protein